MKKAISLFLAVLLLFSVCAVTFASAEDASEAKPYTVTFVDYDGTLISTRTYNAGDTVKAPENPTRDASETATYVFKGWAAESGDLYHASTFPLVTGDATYTAVYSEQSISENQTFWQFVSSIFQRINAIFEYFARLFTRESN